MSRSEEETEEIVGDEGGGSISFAGSSISFSFFCFVTEQRLCACVFLLVDKSNTVSERLCYNQVKMWQDQK